MNQPGPTTKQLDLLNTLMEQTGIRVNTPQTISEAKRMITNLIAIRNKPSTSQIELLENLAASTGAQFTTPKTKREARTEIQRLQEIAEISDYRHIDGDLDRSAQSRNDRDCSGAVGNFAGIREDEVTGYGSSAQWAA